ncbi:MULTISPECIES: histidine phosphatase family protein [Silvimonas]|uniref:histidine phosphatase family protein n=1 Tax=Silvimonas TaxID=300264 RepID=UPI0024B3883A|nr:MULTISPECIES: histidine phosphatase family protein [Silvimonas]MDR3429306.1 histidine phosphatase family protein [Silvimonas sp.]
MRLYLIRHWPVHGGEGICYGQLDLPLAQPLQPEMIAALRRQLPAAAPVFSSPLQRCRLLAERLHPAPRLDSRLQELDFGRWEGQPWQSIGAAALDDWIAGDYNGTAHGGESLAVMQQRVWQWANTAAQQTDSAVVVTHAGVIRALWSRHAPIADCLKQPVPHGEILILDWQ